MICDYCAGHHTPADDLCPEGGALAAYAEERLARCPFAEDKPTCTLCPVHCYEPQMRERIRQVMRYAGPRMLLRHPWLTICHLLDGLRRAPE